MMIGSRAAKDFGVHVGDVFKVEERKFRIVGIFETSNVIGDTAGMFPLTDLQAWHTEPGVYTLAFVRARPKVAITDLRHRIEAANPRLATARSRERLRTRRPQPRADHRRERRRVDPRARSSARPA